MWLKVAGNVDKKLCKFEIFRCYSIRPVTCVSWSVITFKNLVIYWSILILFSVQNDILHSFVSFNSTKSKIAVQSRSSFYGIQGVPKKIWAQSERFNLPVPEPTFLDILPSKSGFRFWSHVWGLPLGFLEVKQWFQSFHRVMSYPEFENLELKPKFSSWILGGRVCSWDEDFQVFS